MNYLSKKIFSKLNILSSRINSAENLNTLLDLSIKSVKELIPCDSASLLIVDNESKKLKTYITHGKNNNSIDKYNSLEMKVANNAVKTGYPIIKNKILKDKLSYKTHRKQNTVLNNLLCVPMNVKEKTIGALEVINAHKGKFTNEDKNILMFIGSITAIGINNRTLFQNLIQANKDLDNRVRELNYLYKLSIIAQKYQNSNDIFDAIIKETSELLKANKAYLMLADDKYFKIVSAIGYDKEFKNTKIKLSNDITANFINYPVEDSLSIASPIIIDKKEVGIVSISNVKDKKHFSTSDKNILKNLGYFIAKVYKSISLREKVTEQNRIKKEIEIATTLQNSFLPKSIPNIDKLNITVFNNTKLDISGNFYDFIEIDESKLAIAMCKVFGKGVPAALSVALFKNLLRGQIRRNASPKSVLNYLNKQVSEEAENTMLIQTAYCLIDTHNCVIIYACNGSGVNFYLFDSSTDKLESLESNKQQYNITGLNEYMRKYNKGDFLLFWTEKEYINNSISNHLEKCIKLNKNFNSDSLLKHILNIKTNNSKQSIEQLNTILIVKND